MIDVSGIDFPDLLDRVGLRNARMTSGGIEINFSCHRPEHSHNDESSSAYINSYTGAFYCHGCLPASEMVLTKQRGYVSISDICQGDKVLGVDGRWSEVYGHTKLRGDTIMIKTGVDKLGLEMTPDHICFRVPLAKAIAGVTALKRRRDGNGLVRLTERPIETNKDLRLDLCNAKDIERGDFLVTPVVRDRYKARLLEHKRKSVRGTQQNLITDLLVDEEMAWFYGLWLAEGSLPTRGISIDMHEDERDIVDRWVEIARRRLKLNGSVFTRQGSKGITATVNNVDLQALIVKNFGSGCASKKVPGAAFCWPQEIQASLVDGYIDGDGDKDRKHASTVSRDLAYGIAQLAIQAGRKATVSGYWPKLHKSVKSRRYTYVIGFPMQNSVKFFFAPINGIDFYWTMVDSVSDADIDQVVYDIGVCSSESFVTKSSLVHNCRLRGTVVDLVADVQQVSRATAERFLRDTYGIEFDEPRGGSMVAETDARFKPVQTIPEPTRPPESWLSNTRLDWYRPDAPYMDYMLRRGLASDTLAEWQVGYDFAPID